MNEAINPEQVPSVEAQEQRVETKPEMAEQNLIQGAEMLEEPKNGSFVSALQMFADWVKNLLAKDQ